MRWKLALTGILISPHESLLPHCYVLVRGRRLQATLEYTLVVYVLLIYGLLEEEEPTYSCYSYRRASSPYHARAHSTNYLQYLIILV